MTSMRDAFQRVRRDPWSSLFAEIALWCFVALLVTGAILTVFFEPDMTRVAYHGTYVPLRDVPVSRAYASTLHVSLEVRGGLLVRQIHHWAALIFIAAVTLHLLRMFFTGAFRRPRRLVWLIWVTLLVLGMAAGWSGTILPDDMLSGGSLELLRSVIQSIPLVGTHLAYWLFGGDFPGQEIIPRFYWLHVLVLPVVMAGLFVPLRRRVRLESFRLAFSTFGILALLATFAQINPVWQYGPYRPGDITSGAVPGWYMGFMDGAVRIMPGWEFTVAGHPVTLAVLVPALLVPGAFFTVLAAYPWIEHRFTADDHDVTLTRTAVGVAGITFYGLLWAAAANDQIAYHFQLSLYGVTWFFRLAVFAGPLLAYIITLRIHLGLTRREEYEAAHGRETGRIVMDPGGGFHELHEPRVDHRDGDAVVTRPSPRAVR